MSKTRSQTEFGDFQTPPTLAREICQRIVRSRGPFATIVEPTCGKGSLLLAAMDALPDASTAIGVEINEVHLAALKSELVDRADVTNLRLLPDSFFRVDWSALLGGLPSPVLVIGNPPWVTNSELGSLQSDNVPRKSNAQGLGGMEALTGKSNFDISEWMLLRVVEWLDGRTGAMVMLCKTAVARKVLAQAWKGDRRIKSSTIYVIDAAEHFGASVDACLLVCEFDPRHTTKSAQVFPSLDGKMQEREIGLWNDWLASDVAVLTECNDLVSKAMRPAETWRSGIKHDCAQVMELSERDGEIVNKLGQRVEIESDYLYPLLKSSDVAQGRTSRPTNWLIVPQNTVGCDTEIIKHLAPKTWGYLTSHDALFRRRRSSIYRNRPRFAIFGVGDYAFSEYKIAISGFYKQLRFEVVGSSCGKPVVFDDTVNYLPCRSRVAAEFLAELLHSPLAQRFYSALIFWDAKRPITVELLRRLDLQKLARILGREAEYEQFVGATDPASPQLLF